MRCSERTSVNTENVHLSGEGNIGRSKQTRPPKSILRSATTALLLTGPNQRQQKRGEGGGSARRRSAAPESSSTGRRTRLFQGTACSACAKAPFVLTPDLRKIVTEALWTASMLTAVAAAAPGSASTRVCPITSAQAHMPGTPLPWHVPAGPAGGPPYGARPRLHNADGKRGEGL